jgi:Protease II
MNKLSNLIFGPLLLATITSCVGSKKDAMILTQSDFPAPPVAEKKPSTFHEFGHDRVDSYFWMKDKKNPKVIDYLKAENAYTDTVMSSTKPLQEEIYKEIVGRIKEDDQSYPVLRNGYYYYSRTEKGKQYRTYCRKKGAISAPEEVIFDVNRMAEGKNAYIFSNYSISPDNSMAAYFYNETGSFAEFILKVKDLKTGKDIGFSVNGATSAA